MVPVSIPDRRIDPRDIDLNSDIARDHTAARNRPRLDVALVGGARESLAVSVLDTFVFRVEDRSVSLPAMSRKLLSLLALRDQPMTRLLVAGTLWPEASEHDAACSLRSALWRLKGVARDALDISSIDVALHSDVAVDLRESRALARRLIAGSSEMLESDTAPSAVQRLSGDVLPGWYDDWVLIEGQEWHQLRLHALEALSDRLAADGRCADAIQAALATVRAEPLRESAHGALIKSFIAEGNQNEALADFYRYRDLLQAELGIEPSSHLTELVEGFRRRSTDH